MSTRICVLGSANMDLVVRQPRLPREGETLTGSSLAIHAGGKGLNQAVAAARAGAEVSFIGCVGDDAHGEALRGLLEGEGIDTRGLRVADGTPTGTAHVSVLDSGENAIVVVPSANAELASLTDLDRAIIAESACLALQLEVPLSIVDEALRFARSASVRSFLTPAPAQPLPRGLLAAVGVLLPNRIEAQQLTGEDDVAEAARRLAELAGDVVVTLGSAGSLVLEAGAAGVLLPPRPAEAVDTTGAGDTFAGTLVARVAAGDGLRAAAEWATVAASISVTRPGASSSMPRWGEVVEAGLADRRED